MLVSFRGAGRCVLSPLNIARLVFSPLLPVFMPSEANRLLVFLTQRQKTFSQPTPKLKCGTRAATAECDETSLASCCAFILILKSVKVHNSLLGVKNIYGKSIEIVIIILISLYVFKQ